MTSETCGCPSTDATTCVRWRYGVEDWSYTDEECTCGCHSDPVDDNGEPFENEEESHG